MIYKSITIMNMTLFAADVYQARVNVTHIEHVFISNINMVFSSNAYSKCYHNI
jgi:hypothetical protein